MQEIACQQVLVEDNSVFSIQWTDLPPALSAGITPRVLLERYLVEISALTGHLVTPLQTSGGIDFNLVGRWPLLRFLPPHETGDAANTALTIRICGGLLVQPQQCDRGELTFACTPLETGNLRVTVRLAGYCPLLLGSARPSWLRRQLYRFTQATIHRLVTVRFLARFYRQLAGPNACIRTVQASVREGERT